MTEDEIKRMLLGGGDGAKLLAGVIERMADEKAKGKNWSLERAGEHGETLRHRFEVYRETYSFHEGDLVRWKPELKNRKKPEYGEPAIVIRVLMDPVYDMENGSGSAYYREPLDIVIGLLDEDGDMMFFHYDSHRFEPFESIISMGDDR